LVCLLEYHFRLISFFFNFFHFLLDGPFSFGFFLQFFVDIRNLLVIFVY
jgi:hypothetical protein